MKKFLFTIPIAGLLLLLLPLISLANPQNTVILGFRAVANESSPNFYAQGGGQKVLGKVVTGCIQYIPDNNLSFFNGHDRLWDNKPGFFYKAQTERGFYIDSENPQHDSMFVRMDLRRNHIGPPQLFMEATDGEFGSFAINSYMYTSSYGSEDFSEETKLPEPWLLSKSSNLTVMFRLGSNNIKLDYVVYDVVSMIEIDEPCHVGSLEVADSDADGVPDDKDVFPYNPNENADQDRDGIGDNTDQCDVTPNDALVDETGCTVYDTDGDGIADNEDVFPNDADESADNDNDGIGDNVDQCDDSSSYALIDETGCSIADYCPCKGNWSHHDKYLACYVKKTNEFKSVGLITQSDAKQFISRAEKSSCGQYDRYVSCYQRIARKLRDYRGAKLISKKNYRNMASRMAKRLCQRQ